MPLLSAFFASGLAGCSLGFMRCRKLIILARVKFPFAQISRFNPKREFRALGNLKAKTGNLAKREFKSQNGKKCHPTGCVAKKGI